MAIISGGLDSAVLAHHLAAEGHELSLLSFDYGQRHVRELASAVVIAGRLGASWKRVDLRSIRALLPGSSLTDNEVEVPEGHYAAETMKATVVPNRNAIMLACAWGHAVAIGAQVVAAAVHAGDHFIYPDCRPEPLGALARAFQGCNEGFGDPKLRATFPFISWTKAEIVRHGHQLGVPFDATWSCYKGGEFHCGKCGTCVERQLAFRQSRVPDPTVYATITGYLE